MKPVLLALGALSLLANSPVAQADVPGELVPALEVLAADGEAEAAYHLGMIYHLGLEGVERDLRRAFDYFTIAAEGGDPLGAYKVGCFYAGQGEGVVEDDAELALRYKLVAAGAGYALAQQDVARHYFQDGNIDEALRWLDAAAHQNDLASLSALSAIYAGFIEIEGFAIDPGLGLAYAVLFQENLPSSESGDRAALLQSTSEELGVGRDDFEQAELFLANWHAETSALTEKASAGQEAARQLLSALRRQS